MCDVLETYVNWLMGTLACMIVIVNLLLTRVYMMLIWYCELAVLTSKQMCALVL